MLAICIGIATGNAVNAAAVTAVAALIYQLVRLLKDDVDEKSKLEQMSRTNKKGDQA